MSNDVDATAKDIRNRLNAHRKGLPGYLDMQRLLTRYAIERLLYRLGGTPYASQFVLKGAMLLSVYAPDVTRSTLDADFLLFGEFSKQKLKSAFIEICEIECEDGLIFEPERIVVEDAGATREYPGFIVTIPTRLGQSACNIRLDIGFGEVVTPAPLLMDYPSLLDLPKPRLRTYPIETIVAEKFQAIVYLGMSNSRLKDYYDLDKIAASCSLNGETLARAIRATFERRNTALPQDTPTGISGEFYESKRKKADWSAFLKRQGLPKSLSLANACRRIERLITPVVTAIASERDLSAVWRDDDWQPINPPVT